MKVLALVCLAAAVVACAYASNQCAKPLDLVLVVEDSDYLGTSDNENDLREFLAAIVNWLKIGSIYGPPNPYDQAAYVLYNTTGNNIFFLDKYTESSDARSAVLATKFSRTTHDSALIHEGLNFAWNETLRVGNGERSCYPTVIVLVSYSKYSDPNHVGLDPKPVEEKRDISSSRNLQNSGALVIVVGVGPNRNPDHLRKVATNSTYYYDYADFSDLTADEGVKIATAACGYTQSGDFFPCEMQTTEADITFVVDVSMAFTRAYADDILAFMKNLMTPYTYDSNTGVQAALVTYAKTANADIRFDDSRNGNLQSFLNAANATFTAALDSSCTSCRAGRCIYSGLEQVNSAILDPAHGYRNPCAVHYVYVFSAGCFFCDNSIDDPVPLAGTIRSTKNAEIFVINLANWPSPATGVGFAFWKEPLEISDDFSHLWEAQADPDHILPNYLHKQAWRTMCLSRIPIDLACPAVTTTAGPIVTTTTAAPTTTTPNPVGK